MTKELAEILAQKIKSVNFLERVGGLVYTQEQQQIMNDPQSGNRINFIHKYPATTYLICKGFCEVGNIYDMIPNSNITGMAYFEERSDTRKIANGFYESHIDLIFWVNTKRLKSDSNLTTAIMSELIRLSEIKRLENTGSFLGLGSVIGNITTSNVFSKYNYKNEVTQYTMPPFDYGKISLILKYKIKPNCLHEVTKNIDIC